MNPYLKIAVAAILASYIAPKISSRFTRPELDDKDSEINTAMFIGVQATSAVAVFAAISTLMGAAGMKGAPVTT